MIGFIGLGNMGAPMALNLAAAGHTVVGYDITGRGPERVQMVGDIKSAVEGADIVVTMLPNGQILRQVSAECLPVMAQDSVFVDCSTVDVESARAVSAAAEKAGVAMLDAPVSGGVSGAEAGTLTFMVGGPTEAFARAEPLFEIMGARAVHCGDAGAGQSAKICNNMILGATMAVTCEAFALAEKLGLEAQALFDVVSTSSGQSWSTTTYCPVPGVGPVSPADRGYRPGFAAELMLKDLRLSQQAAAGVAAETPMGARATSLYEDYIAQGHKDKDFSALFEWLQNRS
ncbi:MAG: 3-hydroxyisobutyrate dehydrogenase [Pseudomonadota bacterium]